MKDFFDYKKPALWITAGLAVASLVPAVLILKKPRRLIPSLEGQSFRVKDILYQAPFYGLTYTVDSAPCYRLGSDLDLWLKDPEAKEESQWLSLGQMAPLILKEDNFDRLFFTGRDRLFQKLRRRNYKAWQLDLPADPEGAFYYLLQEKKGDIYLAYGYRIDGLKSPESQASIIRWLFLMTAA